MPETSPSIGASIVLYRTPVRTIELLIEQLLDQGVERLYLVDNSPVEFDTFGSWSPPDRVVIISTCRNLGYGRGNNLAIRDSIRHHKYHVVCNPDVLLAERLLDDLGDFMEKRPEIGLCAPRVLAPDGSLQYLCKRAPSILDLALRRFAPANSFKRRRDHYEMRDHSYDKEMEPLFISGCFMFFRTSVLATLGGFDERYFLYLEDLDLSRRCQAIAKNVYYPHNHIVHVHQRGAHKSWRLLLHFGVSIFRYFVKWGLGTNGRRLPVESKVSHG